MQALSLTINRGNIRYWIIGCVALVLIGIADAGRELWSQSNDFVTASKAQIAGSVAQAGSRSDAQTLWVVASLDETTRKTIRVGQIAEVYVGDLGRIYLARVSSVTPEPTVPAAAVVGDVRASSLLTVKLDLEGDLDGLTPGMLAHVKIRVR